MGQDFETVIGLEVHIQLATQSKLFCADSTAFGAPPNTQVSAISLAHPGTLPALNSAAVRMAVKLGLALHCQLASAMHFDRKHYFYPDLPKGYQTSQHTHPVCVGGRVPVLLDGRWIEVAIHHVHMEEDAGKSLHDQHEHQSYIDLNRAGTPLLELVTEPVMHSPQEAAAFMNALRRLVQWLGICDGNMEEGSLRADANVSVRPVGSSTLGTRVEIKNLNSIRFLRKAIEAESLRQQEIIAGGGLVLQETRGYDASINETLGQRTKEEANDYRYFPCPDLPPFSVTAPLVRSVQSSLGQLPWEFEQELSEAGLSAGEAAALSADVETAAHFRALQAQNVSPKLAANWLLGPVRSWLNEHGANRFPLTPSMLAGVISLVESGVLSMQQASTRLMPELMQHAELSIEEAVERLGLKQVKNEDELSGWINTALAAMPDKVAAYQKGKKSLMGLFVGEVKRLSKGKADAKRVSELLEEKLK